MADSERLSTNWQVLLGCEMENSIDDAASNILGRLLENKTRYNHRMVQAGILQAEMAQLRIQGEQLMHALQNVWPRRQQWLAHPVQNGDRAKMVKLRGRLHTLCSQVRLSRQSLPIDTSSRKQMAIGMESSRSKF